MRRIMTTGMTLIALAGPAWAADPTPPPANAPPSQPAPQPAPPAGHDLCYAGTSQIYSPGARLCQAGKLMECYKGGWRMARTSMLGGQTDNPCAQGLKLPLG
jgi:hypothetical protein